MIALYFLGKLVLNWLRGVRWAPYSTLRDAGKKFLLEGMPQDLELMGWHAPIKNSMEGQNRTKISKYTVLKGPKKFRGAYGATKNPYKS